MKQDRPIFQTLSTFIVYKYNYKCFILVRFIRIQWNEWILLTRIVSSNYYDYLDNSIWVV